MNVKIMVKDLPNDTISRPNVTQQYSMNTFFTKSEANIFLGVYCFDLVLVSSSVKQEVDSIRST